MQFQGAYGICAVLFLLGCGKTSEQQRIESVTGAPLKLVVPFSGIVEVDGEPTGGVQLTAHNSDDVYGQKDPSQNARIATTYSRPDGRFSFTTYREGDGVEPGDYKITFQWFDENPMGGPGRPRDVITKTSAKDKLGGRYSDPVESEFDISVAPGTPRKDLKFDLATPE